MKSLLWIVVGMMLFAAWESMWPRSYWAVKDKVFLVLDWVKSLFSKKS
jgi:hypothetical protein